MESGQQRSNLTKLSQTDLPLEEPWQDMRGLDVYDITDDNLRHYRRANRKCRGHLRRSGGALSELPGCERRGLAWGRQEDLSGAG